MVTAEFLDILEEPVEEEPVEEEKKPRSINELIDLPYSEMTEEEIELVVEFKASVKARDAQHEEAMKILQEGINAEIAIHQEMADKAQTTLDEMTKHAINRFEDASNG